MDDFLAREEMRGHRLALEFEMAELGLRDMGIRSTIAVFGSSRIREGQPAGQGKFASRIPLAACYETAREFSRIVSVRGGALTPVHGVRENVIMTGAGPGIMEAANRGASDAGAPSVGLNIELPTEQTPNKYITPGLCFNFHYYAVRKMHFAMRANALVAFPGGLGTLDEVFEILALKQTRKTRAMPVILFCKEYWRRVIDFDALVELGTITEADLGLFQIVEEPEEAWDVLVERGLPISAPLKE